MPRYNKYYHTLIQPELGKREFKPVKAIRVLKFSEIPYTFFVYTNPPEVFYKYVVVESTSGLALGFGHKLKDAITEAENNLKKTNDLDKRILYSIDQYGKAPEPYKELVTIQ